MFLKEVREAAQKLRKSDPNPPTQTDPLLMSAKEKIPLWPESSPSKSKMSDSSSKFPERSFTYSHLAQLNFIVPEAIEVKKIFTCTLMQLGEMERRSQKVGIVS